MRYWLLCAVVCSWLLCPGWALAQTPTPQATPTPEVINVSSGTFVLEPTITIGDVGIIIALFVLCGLLLVRVTQELLAWSRS